MRIAIVGAVGEGKTHFVDTVLFRALVEKSGFYHDYGFRIYENGIKTAYRGGTPELVIATFTDPRQAQKFLEGKVFP